MSRKLENIEIKRRNHDEKDLRDEDDLALRAVFFELELVCSDVVPRKEAETAREDQHDEYDIYKRVVCVECKGRTLAARGSQKIEARVTESGDRHEDRVPDALRDTEVLNEDRHYKQCTQPLEKDRSLNNEFGQFGNVSHVRRGYGLLHRGSRTDVDVTSHDLREEGSHGKNAHTADLDQKKNDDLTEQGPGCLCVFYDKSRNASCGD